MSISLLLVPPKNIPVWFSQPRFFPKGYLVLQRKYYNLKDIKGDLAFAQLIWKFQKCGILTIFFNLSIILAVCYKLEHK